MSEGPGPYSMGPGYPPSVRPPHHQSSPVTTGPSPQPAQLQRPMSHLVHNINRDMQKVNLFFLHIDQN